MAAFLDLVRRHRVIALVPSGDREAILSGATAAGAGGIQLLAVNGSMPDVAQIVAELGDVTNLHVGIAGVLDPAQVSLALAMDAQFVMSPVCDDELVRAAFERGLPIIAGTATPSEVHAASRVPADLLQVFPVGLLGGPKYFAELRRQFPTTHLVAAGGVDIESAPTYLEAGATAVVVDRGLMPDRAETQASAIITMRASALLEVCSEITGRPSVAPR